MILEESAFACSNSVSAPDAAKPGQLLHSNAQFTDANIRLL